MRTALIIVGLFAAVAGGIVFWQSRPMNSGSPSSGTTSSIPVDVPIETAALDPQDGSDGQGIATRQFIDGIFVHGVSAVLPEPSVGETYVGWLAESGATTGAVRTGPLVKQGDSYALDYSSPVDYTGYNDVLVTLQRTQQATPETIILRGSFPASQ